MRGDGTYRGMGAAMLIAAVVVFYPGSAAAAAAATGQDWMGVAYISAALAVGLSCIGSAYAVARIGSAGMGAISEKPELTGRVLVFVGLAEGIAIYGLIIAIMILNKL
ncbi:MAG: hypothetical protein AVO39_09930 [delta proteobacterium MLS_D]|jgi:V/A-type H+/Na+-transporting ATPase subunit K|nr:MAG: hypothetical protein AVO39_09930 [delta proteobacterium MLS_D]